MGIQGLLGMLKEIHTPTHVKEYKGKTLAIDAYVWLHRGAYGCAQELATGTTTLKYVNYAMHRVRMLKHYGVTPLIVFDGGLLPSKMGTENDRERRRTEALVKGNAFLAEGKPAQARECFVKAVDVTPAMAYQLIKALRREGVEYIVAPYEADPQLAYLEREGVVDGIITEDSDLLIFGCRTVLFKLDGEGHCVVIERSRFSQCREYNFAGWSDAEFRQMAILSGCDYLDSVVGLGLKTAYKLLRKYKTPEKVIQFVRLEGNLTVPRDYLEHFKRAEMTFLHQRVFCPTSRSVVHFTPLPSHITDAATELPFVGAPLEEEFARKLAEGEIDPITKEPIVDPVPGKMANVVEGNPLVPPKFAKGLSSAGGTSKSAEASTSVAKGKNSILNFFKKEPVASTSIASNKNMLVEPKKGSLFSAKSAKVKSVESLIGTKASRFFGNKSKKGKEKEVVLEVGEDDDDVMIIDDLEVEPTKDEGEAEGEVSDEDDAEAVMRELEMRSNGGVGQGAQRPSINVPEPSPLRRRLASAPSLVALSSPGQTPSPEEARAVVEMLVVPTSDAGVSSPPELVEDEGDEDQMTARQPTPIVEVERMQGCDDEDDGAGVVSSPPASPIKPMPRPIKFERDAEPKVERSKPMSKQGAPEKGLELSSDPIGPSSDAGDDVDQTPRPSKTKPSAKGDFRIYEDVKPVVAPSRSKKRPSQESVESGDEEDGQSVAAVIGSVWRSKYMLPTPRGKTMKLSPQQQASIVTPRSVARTIITTTTAVSTSRSKFSSATKAAPSRVPLSPRKMNRAQTFATTSSSPPLPKLSCSTPASSEPEFQHKSSSPVIITNPNLLKWRFQGAVAACASRAVQQENA